jgi:hypothetical protein
MSVHANACVHVCVCVISWYVYVCVHAGSTRVRVRMQVLNTWASLLVATITKVVRLPLQVLVYGTEQFAYGIVISCGSGCCLSATDLSVRADSILYDAWHVGSAHMYRSGL